MNHVQDLDNRILSACYRDLEDLQGYSERVLLAKYKEK